MQQKAVKYSVVLVCGYYFRNSWQFFSISHTHKKKKKKKKQREILLEIKFFVALL